MDYIERALERRFLCMTSLYKVILVTGARHVGKTTMLKHLAEGHRRTDRKSTRLNSSHM